MSRNSQIFSTSSIDDDGPFEPKHSTPISLFQTQMFLNDKF